MTKNNRKMTKRILSVVLAAALVLTSVLALPFGALAESTKMFVIGSKDNTTDTANVFVPLNLDSYYEVGTVKVAYAKLSFDAKMISGSRPIIGILRGNKAGTRLGSYSEQGYANNSMGDSADEVLTSTYDAPNYKYEAIVKLKIGSTNQQANGNSMFITIGNYEHNGNWYDAHDFAAEMAIANIKLTLLNDDLTDYAEVTLPEINEGNFDGDTSYTHNANPCWENTTPNCVSKAPTNTWNVDGNTSLVKIADIPEGFFSNNHSFVEVPGIAPTKDTDGRRTYWKCECGDCDGKYYADEAGSGMFTAEELVIPKIGEDKMVTIKSDDKATNLFVPLNFDNYNVNADASGFFYGKLTFDARMLNGVKPIIGVLRGNTSGGASSANGTQAEKSWVNNELGDDTFSYTVADPLPDDESHTKEVPDEKLTAKYDALTGKYEAVIRLRKGQSWMKAANGTEMVLTIGGWEHNAAWHDAYVENTEFTFANPKLELFGIEDDLNGKGVEYVLPPFTENYIDLSKSYVMDSQPCEKSNQLLNAKLTGWNIAGAPTCYWNVEGDTDNFEVKDLDNDYFPFTHNFVRHDAVEPTKDTDGNILYYTCDCEECEGKYFDNEWGRKELASVIILKFGEDQTVLINSKGGENNAADLFIPLNFNDSKYDNYKADWMFMKLTFKAKMFSGSKPIVGVLRGNNTGDVVDGTFSEKGYVNNGMGDDVQKPDGSDTPDARITASTFNEETGEYEVVLRIRGNAWWYTLPNGNTSAITIGNLEYNGNWHDAYDSTMSFAFSDPHLYFMDENGASILYEQDGVTPAEYDLPPLTANYIDLISGHEQTGNPTKGGNQIMKSSSQKWSRIGDKSQFKLYDYREGFFGTGHDYQLNGRVEPTEDTDGHIDYYTCECEKCQGKYFRDENGIDELAYAETVLPMLGAAQMVTVGASGYVEGYYNREGTWVEPKPIPANVILPLNFTGMSFDKIENEYFYAKLTFKAKMLEGDKPIIGVVRADNHGGDIVDATFSEKSWANNDMGDDATDSIVSSTYDPLTLEYSAIIKLRVGPWWMTRDDGICVGITIGNYEHNGSWHDACDTEMSFAFTDPHLYILDTAAENIVDEYRLPPLTQNYFNTDMTYSYTSVPCTGADQLLNAPTNKWSVEGSFDNVVMEDLNTEYFAECDHEFSEDWTYDDNYHWHECYYCGAKADKTAHTLVPYDVVAATLTDDGVIYSECECGYTAEEIIAAASDISIDTDTFTANGSVQKPTLTVKDANGKEIDEQYYDVTWSNASSTAAGDYTVTVTFKDLYDGTKIFNYKIEKSGDEPVIMDYIGCSAYTKATLTLTWNKVDGVKGYRIYCAQLDKSYKVKGEDVLTYKVQNLKECKNYDFTICYYKSVGGKDVYSEYSSSFRYCTRPSPVDVVSLNNSSSGSTHSFTVSHTSVKNVSGYEVKYQLVGAKKYETYNRTTDAEKTITVKKAGTYTIWTRAYKSAKYDGVNKFKANGDWSEPYTVEVS